MERVVYDFDRVVRILFVVAVVAGIAWLINHLRGVLLPFVVACVIAYMLDPIVRKNMKFMHCGRSVAAIVTLIEAMLLFVGVCWLLLPYVYKEIASMVTLIDNYTDKSLDIPYLSEEIRRYVSHHVDVDYLVGLLNESQWMRVVEVAAIQTWEFMGATARMMVTVFSWLVVALYLLFLMMDWDKLKRGIRHAIPAQYQKGTTRIVYDVAQSMQHYFRGQALVAAIVGVLFATGFYIVGLPLAIVFGLTIGVMNMVPYLQLISIPFAAILCIMGAISGGGSLLYLGVGTTIVYFVVQGIQDLILTPKIMGKEMGLNPAVILLSLSIWGSLLGFVGLIIALPLTTLVISYYRQYVLHEDKPVPEDKDPFKSKTEK